MGDFQLGSGVPRADVPRGAGVRRSRPCRDVVSMAQHAGPRPHAVRLEPEAAAYAFARRASGKHLVLVADLGGGTSDFSIVQVDADRETPSIPPASTSLPAAGFVDTGGCIETLQTRPGSRCAHVTPRSRVS